MIGAIVGDINGSIYELGNQPKSKQFELWQSSMFFTDDTICTVAIAEVLNNHFPIDYSKDSLNKIKNDLIKAFVKYGNEYPSSYGSSFFIFINGGTEYKPYNSLGNGAAMRVSPVGWLAKSETEVKLLSKAVTEITHNHPEGIKGAEATAMSIYLAKIGKDKEYIKQYVNEHYYNMDNFEYNDLLQNYKWDITCQGTVPIAIYCFLISNSFEDCLRTAISVGGDSDTLAAIAMSIAEAYYQDKEDLTKYKEKAFGYLDEKLRNIINIFESNLKHYNI